MAAVSFATKADAVKRLTKKIDLSKLTKAQARVEIAKDVIASIKTKRIVAEHSYVDISWNSALTSAEEESIGLDSFNNPVRELREVIQSKKTKCEVCAIGACFIAVVARENDYKTNRSYVERYEIVDRLHNYFSAEQLKNLEAAYESGHWYEDGELPSHHTWENFGYSLGDKDDDRLIALMNYVIKNKGEIVLPKRAKRA